MCKNIYIYIYIQMYIYIYVCVCVCVCQGCPQPTLRLFSVGGLGSAV